MTVIRIFTFPLESEISYFSVFTVINASLRKFILGKLNEANK